MRLLLRLSLIGSLTVIFLILFSIQSFRYSNTTLEQQETDEAIKLLLATGEDAQASAGLSQLSSSSSNGHSTVIRPSTELTFNVAIVLVVSLLSVALLITGIIIVAVSLHPSDTPNYYSYNQNLYDSDTDNIPVVHSHRKSSVDEDSGGEYEVGDFCPGGNEHIYHWNEGAQVWSPRELLIQVP